MRLKTADKLNTKYFDIKKRWSKEIVPHLQDEELNRVLYSDFNKYTIGRYWQLYDPCKYPREYETCDWDIHHRGPTPAYWRYVKHGAAHWLVNFNLRLATLVNPEKKWRILTSDEHSTVWDGENTVFEFNYYTFGIQPDQCLEYATETELPLGEYMKVGIPKPVFTPEPEQGRLIIDYLKRNKHLFE